MAKLNLELKLVSIVRDNKNGFFECVNGKRLTRNNIGLLLDKHGDLMNKDTDKAQTLNAFFVLVFNTKDWAQTLG